MSPNLIFALIAYAAGMAGGQIFFKLAARHVLRLGSSAGILAYINIYTIFGGALYFILTIFWIWILRFIPLSKAYPFVALAFIFTPLMSWIIFKENLTTQSVIGIGLVTAGVAVAAYQ